MLSRLRSAAAPTAVKTIWTPPALADVIKLSTDDDDGITSPATTLATHMSLNMAGLLRHQLQAESTLEMNFTEDASSNHDLQRDVFPEIMYTTIKYFMSLLM